MEFIIVTGVSGAGKSAALNFFEDLGFFCVDNLPPALMTKFVEVCHDEGGDINRVVLGIDIRGGGLFKDFLKELDELKKITTNCKILYLDCSDNILVKRYKETRREHPLSKGDRIINGIIKERELLLPIREEADYIINTSNLLTRELKEQLIDIFIENKKEARINVSIISFGFKYGVPNDVDLVFDVRFIPNPFYIQDLKERTGQEREVQDYVMSFDISNVFLDKLYDMVSFLIPNYSKEGKNSVVIGIGCTGGKHRSVTLANKLYEKLESDNYFIKINHNDILK